MERSIAFYEKALAPLGIEHALDDDGADGPVGHPDLKGFQTGVLVKQEDGEEGAVDGLQAEGHAEDDETKGRGRPFPLLASG